MNNQILKTRTYAIERSNNEKELIKRIVSDWQGYRALGKTLAIEIDDYNKARNFSATESHVTTGFRSVEQERGGYAIREKQISEVTGNWIWKQITFYPYY